MGLFCTGLTKGGFDVTTCELKKFNLNVPEHKRLIQRLVQVSCKRSQVGKWTSVFYERLAQA